MANNNNNDKQQHKMQFNRGDEEDDLIILRQNELDSESKRAQYLSYTERYFTRYYKLNVRYENNDHLILMHSNRVAVACLAPTHPALKHRIVRVEFMQSVNDEMSGKHKHFAKNLNVTQPLCKIYCTKEENDEKEIHFITYACLNAKLIELNERLLTQPQLLSDKPATLGYLAILYPKIDNLNDQLADLVTHEDYLKLNKN